MPLTVQALLRTKEMLEIKKSAIAFDETEMMALEGIIIDRDSNRAL
ncbi:MAG: hypothetical protein TUN42_07690 [Dehalogenimonas sp.]